MANKIRVNFHLTQKEHDGLKRLSQIQEVSIASLIRLAVDKYLKSKDGK